MTYVVTDQEAFVKFLEEEGLIEDDAKVVTLEEAWAMGLENCDVITNHQDFPLVLAAQANHVMLIPLNGKAKTTEDVRRLAKRCLIYTAVLRNSQIF